ncbi:hypothetical protein I4U23_016222 [Adineta vaga]|nr:hypothetical protein I4U23_016222 [Adineta vaga]
MTDQSSCRVEMFRQLSKELEESIEEVEQFSATSNDSTDNEAVSDFKNKTSNLQEDIEEAKKILGKVDTTASKSNNDGTKHDDDSTDRELVNNIIIDGVINLTYDLNQVLVEESTDELIDFGQSQQLPSFSTGEQFKPAASAESVVFSKRFDEIIRDYKKSIKKAHCRLNELERDELVRLIIRLRCDLFNNDPSIPLAYEITDEDEKTQKEQNPIEILHHSNEHSNEHSMEVSTPIVEQAQQTSPVADRIVQAVLGLMLCWTLITFTQNN